MKILIALLLLINSLSASNIAIVTIAAGKEYHSLVALGNQSKQTYSDLHGYDFILLHEAPSVEKERDPIRQIYWSKILAVLNALENRAYDWIVWMDADTLIMNQSISLEELIDDSYNFIISEDFNGINSGIFFIRNGEWAREFLLSVYARTDCANELWPEQIAIRRVIRQTPLGKKAKIVPQRLFNSYPLETAPQNLKITYQPGDFILHFASARGQHLLSLFQKYAPLVLNDRSFVTLDYFLGIYGFCLSPTHSHNNEGYMSDEQRHSIADWLKSYPNIESIAEIGLNGGHSAETFFKACPNLKKFTSFDLNQHPYTAATVEYFKRTQKTAFAFIHGDSKTTIPTYISNHPQQLFDLICIDGDHSFIGCKTDILNCQKFAHPDTLLLIDDYIFEVQDAVTELERSGVLEIKQIFHSDGPSGIRIWIIGRYL